MILVFSTSLHPASRSRLLANVATGCLASRGIEHEFVDLAGLNLPPCDGHDCYADAGASEMAGRIAEANGILIATPVYNYDVSATAKNLVELTGNAWNDKVVGLLCAAGGQGSYMAPMGLANSLMLDFRCLVLPGFVYASEAAFADGKIRDESVAPRIHRLVHQLVAISTAWPTALARD